MERFAFARAWEFLGYRPIAKWSAIVGSVVSAVLFVAIIAVFGLYADLLVSQGRIPGFPDLSPAEQIRFRQTWADLPVDRQKALTDEMPLDPDQRVALATQDSFRWHAFIAGELEDRVAPVAAQAYRDNPGRPFGMLSLVVRERDHWLGVPITIVARWNAWSWYPGRDDSANRTFLFGLMVIGFGLALIRAAVVVATHRAAAIATQEATTRLRRAIYHHTYRLGSMALRSLGPAEAVSMFTRHVEALHDGLYSRLTVTVREPVKFVLLLLFALSIHFWFGMAAILAFGFFWLVGALLLSHFRHQGHRGAQHAAGQLVLLQESIKMMRLVKCYLMELFNQARVERQLAEYSKSHLQRMTGDAIAQPLVTVLGTTVCVGMLLLCGLLVLSQSLSVACVVVMAVALFCLYAPLERWLKGRRVVRRSSESAATLFDFLDRRGEVGQVVGAEFLQSISKRLEFDDVSLREPGTGRMLLQGLSLAIPAGKKVALVGLNDEEKYALVYLIPRFLDPSSGEVRIDGKNIRWVTLDSLRNQIGMVLQHSLVFNDTVANNIGCGDPSFNIPQIIEAAKLVHAHQFIQRLPAGYETQIGDLGFPLKPSEYFRIALARAILRDPSILIIEEPPTALDEPTKALIDDTMARILGDRTVIFLPHRISTLRHCDHVFVVHKGKLHIDGEHRELLAGDDLYRHIYYMEFNTYADL